MYLLNNPTVYTCEYERSHVEITYAVNTAILNPFCSYSSININFHCLLKTATDQPANE